jgi:hypothetical protein
VNFSLYSSMDSAESIKLKRAVNEIVQHLNRIALLSYSLKRAGEGRGTADAEEANVMQDFI